MLTLTHLFQISFKSCDQNSERCQSQTIKGRSAATTAEKRRKKHEKSQTSSCDNVSWNKLYGQQIWFNSRVDVKGLSTELKDIIFTI